MKFLWIFTTAIATFFAYHTYTHIRLRYKDLESVMLQNLAVEKGIKSTSKETKKIYNHGIYLTEIMGNSPRDNENLRKAKIIKNYTDSLFKIIDSLTFIAKNIKIDDELGLNAINITLFNEYNTTFPKFVAKQDTSLQDLNEIMIFPLKKKESYMPFMQQSNSHFKYKILKRENKGVDRLIAKIGGVVIRCYFGIPIIKVAKSDIVKSGAIYEASIFITDYDKHYYPEMQISEGEINVRGDVGSIEIKNVKAQNYDSEGKATKTLTGKITIMKADGSDTTFTLSTSYTVKKK